MENNIRGEPMTNKQLLAMLEALKIIVEQSQRKDEIKSALATIQNALAKN